MLDFMDYVLSAFHRETRWDKNNTYPALTRTAVSLLDFSIPNGAALHVSSLSSPKFATSYTLGNKGLVEGSLSYLYTSVGLDIAHRSKDIRLRHLVRGYRHVQALRTPEADNWSDLLSTPDGAQQRDTLLYGRLFLPSSTLHAMYLRRISPTRLLRLTCVSDSTLPAGGSLLASLSNDQGKYSHEYLWSTDSSLFGVRGLYNFGYDPRSPDRPPTRAPQHPWDHQDGRLSIGGELYFSPLNKSGGLSTGLRFTTLPNHNGTPYTMTLTLNPLMGNLSSTYAVKAGQNLSLCSRFDFNVYSYESDVTIGLELWRQKKALEETAWARRKLTSGWKQTTSTWRAGLLDDADSVLKARIGVDGRIGVLWESKVNELLISVGASVDYKHRENLVGNFGCEVSYSS